MTNYIEISLPFEGIVERQILAQKVKAARPSGFRLAFSADFYLSFARLFDLEGLISMLDLAARGYTNQGLYVKEIATRQIIQRLLAEHRSLWESRQDEREYPADSYPMQLYSKLYLSCS